MKELLDNEGEEEEEDGANTLTLSVAGFKIQHIIDVQFISVVMSIYSGLPSSLTISGWDNTYEMRSVECLDESRKEYNPLRDKYFVGEVKVDNQSYLSLELDPVTDDTFFSYQVTKPVPAVLHGPDKINGYNDEPTYWCYCEFPQ